MLPNLGRLLPAARAAGVQVVHCTAYRRADGKGANTNARLFMGVRKSPVALLPGTPEVEVVPELGPEADDLVLTRTHGLDPMAGTDLDPVLRNLGDHHDRGHGRVRERRRHQPRDGRREPRLRRRRCPATRSAGSRATYADAVIDNTLSLLAAVTTTDDLVAIWKG